MQNAIVITGDRFMEFAFVPILKDRNFFPAGLCKIMETHGSQKTHENLSKAVLIGTNQDEGTYWPMYFLPTENGIFLRTSSFI